MTRHESTCSRCGAPLDEASTDCPRCLLALAGAPSELFTDFDQAADDDVPEPEEIGRRLPRFEVGRRIGRGGMGVVFAARDRKLDREVAIKILSRDLTRADDFVQRFLREGRMLALLNHPNIVTVHDFGMEEGLCYLVMELIEGSDLRRVIAEGGLKPEQALALVPQICEALQYAHEKGVVHRDIKPENILLRRDGLVKIADFGIAKMTGEERDQRLTRSRAVIGTPQYMAPEQLERPLEVDHRADIYALGVVLYEMLTGELPLGRFDPPSARLAIDLRVDEVVLRSLEKAPERRYQSAGAVKLDVEEIRRTPAPQAATGPEREAASGVATGARGSREEDGLHRIVTRQRAVILFLALVVCAVAVISWDGSWLGYPLGDLLDRRAQEEGEPVIEARATGFSGIVPFSFANQIIGSGSADDVRELFADARPRRIPGEESIAHPLFVAARRKDREIMRLVAEAFPNDLDPKDAQGDTPLIVAIREGAEASAEYLIDAGADLRVTGDRGRTPLLVAAMKGSRRLVERLLDRLPRPETFVRDRDNRGPMLLAALSGNPSVVQALQARDIDGAFLDDRDMTPLDIAVAEGHRKLFVPLLGAGEYETPAYLMRRYLDRDAEVPLERVIQALDDNDPDQLELGSTKGRLIIRHPAVTLRLLAVENLTIRGWTTLVPQVRDALERTMAVLPENVESLELIDIRQLSAGSAWKKIRFSRSALASWQSGPIPCTIDGSEGTRPGQGLAAEIKGY
ncbi:MAG: protein kinase [Planctomycetes bacterium]|nr:protein kinase [Planctomycetota bacterium]